MENASTQKSIHLLPNPALTTFCHCLPYLATFGAFASQMLLPPVLGEIYCKALEQRTALLRIRLKIAPDQAALKLRNSSSQGRELWFPGCQVRVTKNSNYFMALILMTPAKALRQSQHTQSHFLLSEACVEFQQSSPAGGRGPSI